MVYEVVFAPAARADLVRLYGYLLDQAETTGKVVVLAIRHQREEDYR